MSETVIRVQNLGKQYQLGLTRHDLLSEKVMAGAKGLVRAARRVFRGAANPVGIPGVAQSSATGGETGTIWALKDLSFDVKRGEVVGVIGGNGAGKSTFLKILTGITEPTEGRAWIKGRVGSLLEVGTGFHQELTGRENVFLNGAILGMTRAEIKRKFDEIVAFAEVGKFIDTPVKRYSSGMYVRLAFAVAAYLEPEILLVDEVLAVGDMAFQRKCLGKMGDVARGGRTILFVSHNMTAIESLCSRCVVLRQGAKVFMGSAVEAIKFYLKESRENGKNLVSTTGRQGRGRVRLTSVNIEDELGNKNTPFSIGAKLRIVIEYTAKETIRDLLLNIGVYDEMDVAVARFDTDIAGGFSSLPEGRGQVICSTEKINFIPGRYFLNTAIFSNGAFEDYAPNSASFDIAPSDYFRTGKMFDRNAAKVLVKHTWQVN